MKVLILCNRFQAGKESPWLLDDLAGELVSRGVEVCVVVGSPTVPRPRGFHSRNKGLTILSVGTQVERTGKLARVMARAHATLRMRKAVSEIGKTDNFDAVLYPSIASLYGRAQELLPSRTLRIHILWDFFPTHHRQIGSVPAWPLLERALLRLERWAIGSPDSVLVMSRRGAEFFKEYHPNVPTRLSVVPPWAADSNVRSALSNERPLRLIFGGQLAKGRGVDILIEAAAILNKSRDTIEVVIAGDGPESDSLRQLANDVGANNVSFTGQLSRERYADLLRNAHVGVAITQMDVTSPSFPSKIGDYARAGLPILVATERTSDVGSFVADHGAGLSVLATDANDVANTILEFALHHRNGRLSEMGKRSRQLFVDHLSVGAAVDRILEEVQLDKPQANGN